MGKNHRTLNIWVARTMPVLMIGLVGYATWVFLSLVCIHYLLLEQKQTATAAVLFAIYTVVFLLLATSYLRTIVTLSANPGYVRKGPQREKEVTTGKVQANGTGTAGVGTGLGGANVAGIPVAGGHTEAPASNALPLTHPFPLSPPLPGPPGPPGPPGVPYDWRPRPPPNAGLLNLGEFLNKDIFVCEADGLPRFCTKCNCWKPDRSHHCSEIGRCVWRMDHFCPWVGGVVGETSFRYFYQVVVYGTLYCLLVVISLGVLINERSKANKGVDEKWVVTLVLACVFCTFSAGMTLSTTQLIVGNVSTIDSISAKTKVYQLAIHDPNPPPPTSAPVNPNSYQSPISRVWLPFNPTPGEEQKCFVIVRTRQGENPWKLNSTYDNFKESLGGGFWRWFMLWGVPRPGSTGGEEGFYPWNSTLIARLKKEAGISVGHTNEKVQ